MGNSKKFSLQIVAKMLHGKFTAYLNVLYLYLNEKLINVAQT